MRPTATALHPHSRRRQFRRGRVPREPPPCRGTRPAGSRLLRPFPSTSLFRPPLRPFFSYSGGRRGVADEKRRSRRPGAAAPAGILASGHPDRDLDAVDDALSTVGASGSPAVSARGRRRGGKRWPSRDFRMRADSRVHREWRHCATSGRKGCGAGGERYAPATFLSRQIVARTRATIWSSPPPAPRLAP